jgi:2,5-diketo-D-gluconate reductase B
MTSIVPILTTRSAAMPAIGFGTSSLSGNSAEIIAAALQAGYRHIDTAWKYGSERAVGQALRAAQIPRSEVFITTKVSHEYLRADDFARSVNESLKNLAVDYVDLLLVHWPNEAIPLAETMGALAMAKRRGLARYIGVANFNTSLLDHAIQHCPEPLSVLQAEYHPYLDQTKLLTACRRHELIFTAFCPLARGRMFNDPVLGAIARRRGRTIAQVALRWLLQQNVAAIPRSSNPQRIAENIDVFDFALTDHEMKQISALKKPDGRIANPAGRVSGWD